MNEQVPNLSSSASWSHFPHIHWFTSNPQCESEYTFRLQNLLVSCKFPFYPLHSRFDITWPTSIKVKHLSRACHTACLHHMTHLNILNLSWEASGNTSFLQDLRSFPALILWLIWTCFSQFKHASKKLISFLSYTKPCPYAYHQARAGIPIAPY